jgi:sulfotransferase family protein
MKNVIIHIGFHKSASTFRQSDVFPQLPVRYVFLAGPSRQMLDMAESEKEFDANALREWIVQETAEEHKKSGDEPTIISHEELSGHPHGYDIVDPITTARNLKEAFPEAKILIIIRNQFDYLTSIYTFRVAIKGAEYRSFDRFLTEEGKKGLFAHLEYHQLVKHHIELFGREQVLVLPMEYLRARPEEFFHDLTGFIGVPNESVFPS